MGKIATIKFIVLLLVLSLPVLSQTTTYEVKSHSLKVEGTSNLHDWYADVEKVKGSVKLNVDNGKITGLEGLSIVVDARSFKASRGNIMNSKINEALNTKNHPEIRYELARVNSISESGGVYTISTTGQLVVSGVARTVDVNASGRMRQDGTIELTGSTAIKMSDHKVSPPTAMFGALTTGDEVTLKYSVVLQSGIAAGGK